ncbi:MAG: VOC family protein [Marinifilaceae bacterium]|jgi:PhnB protein|nr:VOC family protein [Marinifilaceae bacterium]
MITVNPYLMFNGNCEEAFSFYKKVLKKECSHLSRFKEQPENPECKILDEDKEKIMHISLDLDENSSIMGCDIPSNSHGPSVVGNNFSLSLNISSKEEADRIFKELAQGGEICMPMAETFWGSYFGMVMDKYNINWMISFYKNLDNH